MSRVLLFVALAAALGCQDRIQDDPKAPEQGLLKSAEVAADDLFACPTCVFDHTCTHRREDSVAMVHEGKRYHFCKAQCLADFREQPDQYVTALRAFVENPPADLDLD